MAFQRAAVIYPINSVTVDSGALVNVRGMDASQAGATDATQGFRINTQGSNAERRFNAGVAANTAVVNAATTNDGAGWGIPTADMATVDASCLASLAAQTVTVNMVGVAAGTGTGAVGANDVLTPRASLWKWDPTTDTAVLIAGASGAAQSISAALAYSGTAWAASVAITIAAAVTLSSAQLLMLCCGGNLACGAGLAGGARTTTWTLHVDIATTNVTFGTSGLRQACTTTTSMSGEGITTRDGLPLSLSRSLIGEGLSSRDGLAIVESRSLIGEGVTSRVVAATVPRTLVGEGLVDRQVALGVTRDTTGEGLTSRVFNVGFTRSLVGEGLSDGTKAVVAARSFDVVGEGFTDYVKATQANRSFDLAADGVVTGRIELPIDDVPEGGGGTIVRKPIYLSDE